MIEITDRAAMAIASACTAHEVSGRGGVRIVPRSRDTDISIDSLVVEFVDSSQVSDTVVTAGDAAVFLARGVGQVVGDRVLDVDIAVEPPQLVLRTSGRARKRSQSRATSRPPRG